MEDWENYSFFKYSTEESFMLVLRMMLLEILHTHLGFIFPKVVAMFISDYSISYSLGRIFL
jgi:hypothetical protein